MMLFPALILLLWGGAAAYNLVRGLLSGSMRCFYALAPAEAAREQRPARYWTYAGANLAILAFAALILFILAAGGAFSVD